MKAFFLSFQERVNQLPGIKKVLYCLVCFFLSLYFFSVFSFSARPVLNYVNLAIGVALMVLVLLFSGFGDDVRFDFYFACLFGFCVSAIVSTLLQGGAFSLNKSLFFQAAFGWVLFQFVRKHSDFNVALAFALAGGLAFCLYYFVHYRVELINFSFTSSETRLGSFFDNENNVARSFVFIGLVASYLAIRWKLWFLWLILPIMLLFVLSTGSISNLLCFGVSLVVLFFIFVKGIRGKLIVVGVLIAAIIALVALLQLPQLSYFNKRFFGMLAALFGFGGGDGSAKQRFELARDAFIFFADSPLFGHGAGYVISHTQGGFSHNNIAELLANFGLFGFLFFEALLFVPAIRVRKKATCEAKFSFVLVLYLIIFQWFLVTYYQKIDHIMIAIAFGGVCGEDQTNLTVTFKERRPCFSLALGDLAKCNMRGFTPPVPIDSYKIGSSEKPPR